MKRMNLRNTLGAALLVGGTLVGASAVADAPQGGNGPGMMGGYGQGGYGPGMMGGYDGYGMGPGMMGGYGGYGMGPGMMGGYGGNGMGPGMMGGYGGNGMGPAMMYGYGGDTLGGLTLTDDQREKITKIQEALSTKHWELMGKMQAQQFQTRGLLASGNADDAAIGKGYKNLEGLRQQMWTSGADAQKQMDAVLTKSQREQLQRNWSRERK
ncbi:MAG: Spy/CpxP family protein refolding chaperone [Casimicrobiaceae bacterium]